MGIIKNIKNYFGTKRRTRLKKDLMILQNELQFNPLCLPMGMELETPAAFTKCILEYKIWSMGDKSLLRRAYMTMSFDADGMSKYNYFWHSAPPTVRMMHTGIPRLISAVMPDILFGGGTKTNVIVYGESGENKAASKKANELLDNLCSIMQVQDRITEAATNESWGGHCFFKLSHDISVSEYPILETYDMTQAEVVKVKNVTKAVIFKRWYVHDNDSYRLDEICSTNDIGEATTQYKLHKREADGKVREVDLFYIDETQDMFYDKTRGIGNKDGIHIDADGMFTYEGLIGMLAFEKPNRTPSMRFPSSDYGASDYEGSVDSFDGLDEIYSANIEEIRTNKTKRYIPDVMMPRDSKNEILPFDEFSNNYVKVVGDDDQGVENKIDIQEIPDKTDSYKEKWKTTLTTVCNNAKISPWSLGVTWLESVDPSADNQQEKSKITRDMRKSKHKLWKPMLEEVLLGALRLNTWIKGNTDVKQEAFDGVDITWDNCSVQVEFGEFIDNTPQDLITTWGGAKQMGVASPETAIEKIHPDWTKKQIQDEVNLIRFYEGVSADNPDNLLGLNGREGEDE